MLKPGAAATERELIDFVRERLAHFKAPHGVTFLSVAAEDGDRQGAEVRAQGGQSRNRTPVKPDAAADVKVLSVQGASNDAYSAGFGRSGPRLGGHLAQQDSPFHDYRTSTGRHAANHDRRPAETVRDRIGPERAEAGPTARRRFPQAMPGYTVALYATGLDHARLLRTAPNGDLFVVESRPGRIKVLRGAAADGRAQTTEIFASGLNRPFGVAFYPPGPKPTHVYVGNTDSIVRFPYRPGDLKARGAPEVVVPALPYGGQLPGGGHWTRDVVFSRDGKKMFVGVGSLMNVDDPDRIPPRKTAQPCSSSTPTAAVGASMPRG